MYVVLVWEPESEKAAKSVKNNWSFKRNDSLFRRRSLESSVIFVSFDSSPLFAFDS